MVTPSIFAISLPVLLSLGTIAAWWAAALPRLAVAILGGSVVLGQLVRLPLPGQGGGLLVSDIAVLLVIAAALYRLILRKKQAEHSMSSAAYLLLLSTPFLIWSAYLLAVHIPSLGWNNFAIAAAYWVRLATHILLLPALVLLFEDVSVRKFAHQTIVVVAACIVGLGFLQLLVFPNLGDLSEALSRVVPFLNGVQWDPHSGRLVSTWLDPNFVGGFLVVMAPYLAFKRKYALLSLTIIALLLTQSRSSFLAAGSVLLLSPLLILHGMAQGSHKRVRAMRITIAVALLCMVSGLAALNLGSRFTSIFLSDPTVDLRVASLQVTWQALAQKTFIIGEGYNAYQFAAAREGLVTSFTTHSRAGSDTSLLTLWITTGIVGVVLFLLPWAYGIALSWHRAWHWHSGAHFVPIVAFLALLTHSLFVNSLLYGHVLIVLGWLFALSVSSRSHEATL